MRARTPLLLPSRLVPPPSRTPLPSPIPVSACIPVLSPCFASYGRKSTPHVGTRKTERCTVKRLKLSEKTVREAANIGRAYQTFDTDVRGFSITIYPYGNRAFTLDDQNAGFLGRRQDATPSSVMVMVCMIRSVSDRIFRMR